ncbi:hypothetical protein WDW89_04545 [Deltaproteobacteria bacterium TL4]
MKQNAWWIGILGILLLGLVGGCAGSAYAVDLERAVASLEAAGDFETAEPIAFKLVQDRKEYYYRIEFLRKYPVSTYVDVVYEQTWKDVKNSDNTAKYRSFVKARPAGSHSMDALDSLLALYKKENTILGYQEYLTDFPNSPQAVDALNGVYSVAYNRAVEHAAKKVDPSILDEYIRTFPGSSYLEQANTKAEEVEYKAVIREIEGISLNKLFTSKQEQKETVARRLYNEMRQTQQKKEFLIGQRKYSLLQKEMFLDTKAFTELMDREETLAFRREVLNFQRETGDNFRKLQTLYQQESQRIVQTIQREAELTRQVISEQGQRTRSDIQYMASQIADLSFEKGRLADAIQDQTRRIEDESRRASSEQEQMFAQAQEQSKKQQRHALECNEVLSKKGKYTFWSGCP